MANDNAPRDYAAEMLKDPTKFGLSWAESELHADRQKSKTLGKWPLLEMTDVAKFRATVPNADEIILGASNGTSLKVSQQAVRNVIRKDGKFTKDQARAYCVNRILGVRNKGVATPKEVSIARAVWATMPKAAQDAVLAANNAVGVKVTLVD